MSDTIHPKACGAWGLVEISDLLHERDPLRAALIFCQNTIEWMQRGTTHWDKCEEAHPLCAMALRIAAALAAKEKP
ncbi:hypothetical protein [Caudoviricetes sp.]|nr:hypothetical protein [Caudoviricetes sp.]